MLDDIDPLLESLITDEWEAEELTEGLSVLETEADAEELSALLSDLNELSVTTFDIDEDAVRVLIIYVSVGVFVFPPENVPVRDMVLVVTGDLVCETVVEEVFDLEADAETVDVRRPLTEVTMVLDCVTELVDVLEGNGDLE